MEDERLPDQAMTYAVGDIHGEVTLLKQLLALLPYREQDTLVFLGDYLDRGEDSVVTIQTLRALKREHPLCIFLRGNAARACSLHLSAIQQLQIGRRRGRG